MTRGRPLVGVNGLFLDHPGTGTGVYTREVLARLLCQPDELRYLVAGHPEHESALPRGEGSSYLPMRAPLRGRSVNAEKILWEQVTLPLFAARRGVDLLYAPYFSLPLWKAARAVVTVHDLIPLVLPEYAPSAQFKAYFRLVGAAARRADAVVTDSKHAADDIARVLGVPPRRIHVIYLGVDPRYSRVEPQQAAELRARLGLPERFTLYLGGIDPRKNVGLLLRALRRLRDGGCAVAPLALAAGPKGGKLPARWGALDPRAEAARLGLEREVIFLDWVAEADKPALYAAAGAFAYPSRYEGFGLPPLEAMAAGTPVLCSNASSLPEVTGDAALALDPDDVDAWAEALARLDADAGLRADLAARGRARAAQFTWERTAGELRAVLRSVLEE